MTIDEIIAKYNGKKVPGTQWWAGNADIDPSEMVVELPISENVAEFEKEMNEKLDQPIQHFAVAPGLANCFLYYLPWGTNSPVVNRGAW